MKLRAVALRALNELDEAGKAEVEKMVREHIRACRLNGFQPENLEIVYTQAIEIVRLEGVPKPNPDEPSKFEPARNYKPSTYSNPHNC